MSVFRFFVITLTLLASPSFAETHSDPPKNCAEILDVSTLVFHASPVSGLQEIHPTLSTHGESWIYATRYIEVAATFLAKWNDLDFSLGVHNGELYFVERRKGAFHEVFANKSGSIYYLRPNNFRVGKTSFNAEVVSSVPAEVQHELRVADALETLLTMNDPDEPTLYFYPNRPDFIPKDDSDLLKIGYRFFTKSPNPMRVYKEFVGKHPGLQDAFDRVIRNDGQLDSR